ncbi:anti-sigma B factor antagonist [Murinocardiopsis flavida]|uniref:Anti-sigma factor antagonist n=1 Tax=Murinocardiopsis flavida TaxID=645275 RepID=A0A2P8DKP9_9ACTN|nr:STAS domain-containing protein [Murinocardiopsis flavida]PSK97802.1 anti-sigma B factor antagonist [Murinocardiopsis flavida]
MRRLRAEFLRHNGATVVRLTGDVDLSNVRALEARLAAAEAVDAPWMVVDLTGMGFVDSTVLGALLRLERRLAGAGRGLSVLAHDGRVSRVLRIGGLGSLLRSSPTRG